MSLFLVYLRYTACESKWAEIKQGKCEGKRKRVGKADCGSVEDCIRGLKSLK